MSAAREKAPTPARLRMTEILEQIDDLIGEFEDLKEGPLAPRLDAVNALYSATFEAREMIGDLCDDNGDWHVAAGHPLTRRDLRARLQHRARVLGVVSR